MKIKILKTLFVITAIILSIFVAKNVYNIWQLHQAQASDNIEEKEVSTLDDSSIDTTENIPINQKSNENINKTKTAKEPDIYESTNIKVSSYLRQQKGTYGMYFIDLSTGKSFGYNSSVKFIGASTVKVPVALYTYELIKEKKINFNTKYRYTRDDDESGTGSLQYNKIGGYYTVKELLNKSIRISDNVAVNILLREGLNRNIYGYTSNIIGKKIDFWDNKWTPQEMASIMNTVYTFSKNNSELGKDFLDNLENTIFNDRINKYITNVPVAHKIGNQTNIYNDVGIVFSKKPYVIVFMSKDVNEETGCEVIAKASKMIYDNLGNR